MKSAGIYEYFIAHWSEFEARYSEGYTSETELARTLGLERFATRRALHRLSREGRVLHVRQQGYRFRPLHFNINLNSATSYSRFCAGLDLIPRVLIVAVEHWAADEALAERLKIAKGDLVWHIYFQRFAGEVPFCLTHSWLPHARTKGLLTHLKTQSSLYTVLLQAYGIKAQRCRSSLQALSASLEEARLLDTALASPLLKVASLAQCQDGIPIEYCESSYRADLVSFNVELNESGAMTAHLKGNDNESSITH